jgi:small subunit ribosomal protein S4
MYVNIRFKNSKKQKYYSKHRIVSWKILGKLRIKGNLKNQKPKWRFLRYSLLNMKDFLGKRKKLLGLQNSIKSKEDFRIKPRNSCLKKFYRESLNEIRKIRSFFGFLKIQTLKKLLLKYPKSTRSREKLLINYLESRLDIVIYRMGFASSILESSKFILNHLVKVNGSFVLKRNFQVNSGDNIKFLGKVKSDFFFNISNNQNKIPSNFEVNYKKLEGIFLRKPLKKELMYPEIFCFKKCLRRLEK